jgi:hypothetical protein
MESGYLKSPSDNETTAKLMSLDSRHRDCFIMHLSRHSGRVPPSRRDPESREMQIKLKRSGSRSAFRFAELDRDDELQHSLEGGNPEIDFTCLL